MNLIIPAAGQSSRFPKMRPKWMLTHPNGNLMLAEAIRGLVVPELEKIYLTVLSAHLQEFQCLEGIQKQFAQLGLADKLVVVALDKPTQSQPETIARAIERQHGLPMASLTEIYPIPQRARRTFSIQQSSGKDAADRCHVGHKEKDW